MIGFNTHDPTYAIAHNECLIRIHFHEISKLIRTARNTSIQQLLHEETFSGELDMQAWYKGAMVPFDMKIKSGGSLRFVCARAPGNEDISPTIPFQVDKEEKDKTLPNSRWSHITTQPGPKTICRVWEQGFLIAEFPIDTEMLKDLPIERGVIDFQQIHGTQEKLQIFIKGFDGPTKCVTVEPHHKIQQIAEKLPLEDIKSYKVHYGARLLDMRTTVAQAGIHNHATIHFTTRSKGGGKHAKETQLEGVKHKPKKKTTYQSPPLDSLTIAVGSFLLSNGDHAPIGGSFCLSGVGVFTIPPYDYDALTTSKQALVPHELALLVLLQPKDIPLPCNEVDFAATDQRGNSLLLKGWLIQFGTKKITQGQVKDMQITLEVCNTLAVTAFRDEWQEKKADWKDLVAGPAKLVIDTLSIEADGIYEVWGRSWRKNNHPIQPDDAASFRIWLKVKATSAVRPLDKSGFTFPPFYVETKLDKDQDMQMQRDFRIMWIPKDTPASDVVSKIPEHRGLVRGRTGQGIRLEDAQFKKAYGLFYPNRPLPEKIIANYKWILLGAPSSATQDAITKFLISAGIKGRPLRKSGRNWRIDTEENLQETQFSINGNNVLFQLLPNRQAPPNPVRAFGPGKGDGKGKGQDILQQNDPWAKSAQNANTAQDKNLQVHQKQINTVQTEVNELKNAVRQLQAKSDVQDQKTTQIQKDIRDVKDTFSRTLDQKMQEQTSLLMQSMEQLLQGTIPAGHHTEQSNPKRAKLPKPGDDMEDD